MVIIVIYYPYDTAAKNPESAKKMIEKLEQNLNTDADVRVKFITIPRHNRTDGTQQIDIEFEVLYPKFVVIDEGQMSELRTGIDDLTTLLESQSLPT